MSKMLNHIPSTMTLNGQGQVVLTPNQAIIHLGVETSGSDLEAVQAENAQISRDILNALQGMDIMEIKTIQYTIGKNYEYENGVQIDKGYVVRNIFEIITNHIDQTGSIIDAAVNQGANVVNSIAFDASDRDYYYRQALNLALENAIQKAKSIAMNLGLHVAPKPVRIVENSTAPAPLQQFQREAAATPIIPGNIQINAFVTVDFI